MKGSGEGGAHVFALLTSDKDQREWFKDADVHIGYQEKVLYQEDGQVLEQAPQGHCPKPVGIQEAFEHP